MTNKMQIKYGIKNNKKLSRAFAFLLKQSGLTCEAHPNIADRIHHAKMSVKLVAKSVRKWKIIAKLNRIHIN